MDITFEIDTSIMLAQAFVMVETKYDQGRVPSWTIFPKLDEVTHAKYNRSIDMHSLAILQNIDSLYIWIVF
jgi:hypothetical protein